VVRVHRSLTRRMPNLVGVNPSPPRGLRSLHFGFGCIALVALLGPACGGPQPTAIAKSPSPSAVASPSPFFDSAPRELVTGFAPGIGGNMACSSTDLVFDDGPQHTLYTTGVAAFRPRKLLSVNGNIGPIRMSGSWAAFAVYTQAGEELSPLGAWSVYAVEITSGRSVVLARGTSPTELSELPFPTVGDGFIVWDELMSGGNKVLWRYDTNSGSTTQLRLPGGTYPVRPSAAGGTLLFLDNSRDSAHASETWFGRGGEPLLMNMGSEQITHLASSLVVTEAVLTSSRAVWIYGSTPGTRTVYDIQEVAIPGGTVRTLVETDTVAPLTANAQITIWFSGVRGAVTARLGSRTAVVSPDLTTSPGGTALCGSDFYYGGPNLSLRVAHIA
jgi:hypothetical protein